MTKFALGVSALALAAFLAGPAAAGNGAPSGPHYNLNIIGVENAKKPKMTGTNGPHDFRAAEVDQVRQVQQAQLR